MNEKDLIFDRTKHVIYTPKAKAVIQKLLRRDYSLEEAEKLWEKIQLQYAAYLEDEPALGGLKLSAGVYDSILVFAYYVTVPQKPALADIQQEICSTFMGGFDVLGKIFNLNRRLDLKLAAKVFRAAMEAKTREAALFPASFHVGEFSFDPKEAIIRYSFTQCPNAEFAKRHHLEHVLPLMCNCDHMALQKIHAGLIRCSTCATGCVCDYCILGDQNPLMKDYTLVTDENGLWLSQSVQREAEKEPKKYNCGELQ